MKNIDELNEFIALQAEMLGKYSEAIEKLKERNNLLNRIAKDQAQMMEGYASLNSSTARECIDIYLSGRRNMQEEIGKKLKSFDIPDAAQIAYSIPVDCLAVDAQTPNA